MDSKLNVLLSQMFIRLFSYNQIISDELYNQILFFLRTGRRADIRHPKTFNEYILNRKVFADEDELTVYTDKYEVREYVRRVIGSEYLVNNYGVWDHFEDIDRDALPQGFVLKATHGSGWNVIVKDKDAMNWDVVCNRFSSALKSNYYNKSRERNYKNIVPRLICEELLVPNTSKGLIDFKVFCFWGKSQFFSVNYSENNKAYHGLFFSDGRPIPIRNRYHNIQDDFFLHQRELLNSLAEKLASPFEFVRVDFYLCDSRIYFSELTFHSGGGIVPIEPPSVNLMLGSFFEGKQKEE